ncbi:conserved hypothetical protein [Trichinella spiralis]|uniref:hypothetical protein n=1 Tax=Trichinella spiralis TaxID=6334 RepID=UPI0001EFE24B|nr:conserved hypothetical protein [Trichinella spiralis]
MKFCIVHHNWNNVNRLEAMEENKNCDTCDNRKESIDIFSLLTFFVEAISQAYKQSRTSSTNLVDNIYCTIGLLQWARSAIVPIDGRGALLALILKAKKKQELMKIYQA